MVSTEVDIDFAYNMSFLMKFFPFLYHMTLKIFLFVIKLSLYMWERWPVGKLSQLSTTRGTKTGGSCLVEEQAAGVWGFMPCELRTEVRAE